MEKLTLNNYAPKFGKDIGKVNVSVPATAFNDALDYVEDSIPTPGALVGDLTGNVTGNLTGGVVVANEATDVACFPTFVTAATGALPPKSNAALTFNSNTATLACTNISATTFTGALTGNASTATSATSAGSALAIPNASADLAGTAPTNAQMIEAFGAAAIGKVGIYHDSNVAPKNYMCISTATEWWQVLATIGTV